MADDRMTIRVPEDTLARIDDLRGEVSRSGWVLGVIGRELADGTGGAPAAVIEVTGEIPPGGIPSPGVYCQWAGCWNRDTRRYGVTDPAELARTDYWEQARDENAAGHALCPAHAARLGGLIFRRPVTPPRVGSAA